MGCSLKLQQHQIISKYPNYIICEHSITKENLNKKIRVINHNNENYKSIPESCDIYINGEKKESLYDYEMIKKGKNRIIIGCKTQLKDINTLFASIFTLTSLDFSHFNTSQVFNMNSLFFDMSTITNLDLSNFITDNVTDMSLMFKDCSSLINLNLSNVNTNKVVYIKVCLMDVVDLLI